MDENSLLVSDVSIYIISIKEPIQVISRIEGNNFGSIIKINDKQILIGDIEGFLECYNIKEKSLRYCGKKKNNWSKYNLYVHDEWWKNNNWRG